MGKITRIESFSFTLKDMHYFPIIIKFVVILVILVYICISFNKSIKEILINGAIALLYCITVALYAGYWVVYKIILNLEQNSLLLIKKALLNTKTTVYKSGELEKVAIYYNNEGKSDKNNHIFKFYFIKKNFLFKRRWRF